MDQEPPTKRPPSQQAGGDLGPSAGSAEGTPGEEGRPDQARVDTSFIAAAFARARAKMSAVPAAVSGYRLFWVHRDEVHWQDLPVGGPYAIIGSHPLCSVVIDEPGVALRHLLATTIELSDGVALRLLDLHTDLPFVLQDGSRQRSIVGTGSVVALLGRVVIGAVPVDAGEAPEAPAEAPGLPELVVTSASRVPESVAAPPAEKEDPAPPAAAPSARPRSRVTSMPPSKLVAQMSSRPARQAPAPPAPPAPPHPYREAPPRSAEPALPAGESWTVTLERQGMAAVVTLTDAALYLGVMIGRGNNCFDDGLRAVLDGSISRGHLLLLHHHDTYEAYDLCSMNGTWEAGTAVRRRRLGAERVTLELSNQKPVVLHWHGRE
jgi:hypothetical protein